MTHLVILGSAMAVPDPERENTHMALVGAHRTALVDCAGTPVVRLGQAGIILENISDLILTHFHPDHVSGVPMLLMNMWLLGRQQPLSIHGTQHCLERVERMMEDFLWHSWPKFYGVEFREVAQEEGQLVVEAEDFRIHASPVDHLIPTIGLRFEGPGKTAAYSCDTAPCAAFVRLARGADVLIHEASGESPGHSSARQAGEIASQAGAERLLLIHYPRLEPHAEAGFLAQSQESFAGEVGLAIDWMRIEL